ncbi:unnamed protein product [Closterium sp. NIES-64]|nr:unnamed protein product [Closterium sp. NIES-64]CAI5963257.1 unnamed protein product [Closterium sp. NIES-64]
MVLPSATRPPAPLHTSPPLRPSPPPSNRSASSNVSPACNLLPYVGGVASPHAAEEAPCEALSRPPWGAGGLPSSRAGGAAWAAGGAAWAASMRRCRCRAVEPWPLRTCTAMATSYSSLPARRAGKGCTPGTPLHAKVCNEGKEQIVMACHAAPSILPSHALPTQTMPTTGLTTTAAVGLHGGQQALGRQGGLQTRGEIGEGVHGVRGCMGQGGAMGQEGARGEGVHGARGCTGQGGAPASHKEM